MSASSPREYIHYSIYFQVQWDQSLNHLDKTLHFCNFWDWLMPFLQDTKLTYPISALSCLTNIGRHSGWWLCEPSWLFRGYVAYSAGCFRRSSPGVTWSTGGCFIIVSWAPQNILPKFAICINGTFYENFKLKLCTWRACEMSVKQSPDLLTTTIDINWEFGVDKLLHSLLSGEI